MRVEDTPIIRWRFFRKPPAYNESMSWLQHHPHTGTHQMNPSNNHYQRPVAATDLAVHLISATHTPHYSSLPPKQQSTPQQPTKMTQDIRRPSSAPFLSSQPSPPVVNNTHQQWRPRQPPLSSLQHTTIIQQQQQVPSTRSDHELLQLLGPCSQQPHTAAVPAPQAVVSQPTPPTTLMGPQSQSSPYQQQQQQRRPSASLVPSRLGPQSVTPRTTSSVPATDRRQQQPQIHSLPPLPAVQQQQVLAPQPNIPIAHAVNPDTEKVASDNQPPVSSVSAPPQSDSAWKQQNKQTSSEYVSKKVRVAPKKRAAPSGPTVNLMKNQQGNSGSKPGSNSTAAANINTAGRSTKAAKENSAAARNNYSSGTTTTAALALAATLTTTKKRASGTLSIDIALGSSSKPPVLDFAAARAVDATTEQGFKSFQTEMGSATLCSIGLLLSDSRTGTEMYSSLEPLSKEQIQRLKVLVNGGKRKKTKETTNLAQTIDNTSSSYSQADKVIALALLPIPAELTSSGAEHSTLYLLPLHAGKYSLAQEHNTTTNMFQQGKEQQQNNKQQWIVDESAVECGKHIVDQLLHNNNGNSVVCFNTQGLLRLLASSATTHVPRPHHLTLIDPKLLAWLKEPHILQKNEKELEDYSLQELVTRHIPSNNTAANNSNQQGILSTLRSNLTDAVRLAEHLHASLTENEAIPLEAQQREIQVAGLLAEMENTGLGFDPWLLLSHGDAVRKRMEALKSKCAALVGYEFNVSSAVQVSEVLYQKLGLPAPTAHGRAAAKTHLPTDENALSTLMHLSEVPGLILEHRALQNFLSKFVDCDWVQKSLRGCLTANEYFQVYGDWPRVYCTWNQTATATGRLSSSGPNLQAITKYHLKPNSNTNSTEPTSAVVDSQSNNNNSTPNVINVRDAFVASSGCTLIAADYSQVELRVLAHLSADPTLLAVLRQSGTKGDALRMLAATWLRKGTTASTNNSSNSNSNSNSMLDASAASTVTEEERNQAKRVVYGLVYGISAYGLSQGAGNLGISVGAAQNLIDSFLQRFPGVKHYLERVKSTAKKEGYVRTIAGRIRPIPGLSASRDKRNLGEAERKAVNTIIQGSAADIIKGAMIQWCQWKEAMGDPPIRLLAQLHDELIFEVNTSMQGGMELNDAVAAVRHVMEATVELSVPLVVNIKAGERWGSMVAVSV